MASSRRPDHKGTEFHSLSLKKESQLVAKQIQCSPNLFLKAEFQSSQMLFCLMAVNCSEICILVVLTIKSPQKSKIHIIFSKISIWLLKSQDKPHLQIWGDILIFLDPPPKKKKRRFRELGPPSLILNRKYTHNNPVTLSLSWLLILF